MPARDVEHPPCPMARTDFDPYAPGLGEPAIWTAYADLRETGRVAWSAHRGGFWMISGYDEVRAALQDPDTFSSASGHRLPFDGSPATIPIDFDRPMHSGYRKVVMQALSPARVRRLRPFLDQTVTRLVQAFWHDGGGDFVRAVSLPLPLHVLAEIVGFSPDVLAKFQTLAEQIWSTRTVADFFSEARDALAVLMRAELAEHRRRRPDDFVTYLLDAEIEEGETTRRLAEDEQVQILMALASAGTETTMNSAGTLVHLLVGEPGLQDRLRADPGLAPRCVEEMLRYRTPSQNFARRTTCPVKVGETELGQHDAVLLSYAAANRDPQRFPDPDTFDPDRDTRGHLAFGWGIHLCPGSALVRSELVVLLETLCRHPRLVPDGPVAWGPLRGGNNIGPTELPLRFAGVLTPPGSTSARALGF